MASLFPVIHYTSDTRALQNAEIAREAGCGGVFLIEMGGNHRAPDRVAGEIKRRWPQLLVGANRLGAAPADAVRRDADLGLDMSWHDAPGVSSRGVGSDGAALLAALRDVRSRNPGHLCFASVAFKYQKPEPDPALAAQIAARLGLVATTSGKATGEAADIEKIRVMKEAIGSAPLAVASGITPENVAAYLPHVEFHLAATGISFDFSRFDPARVRLLQERIAAG